jgi:hypothetical protein
MSILRAQGAPLLLRDGRTAFNSLRFEDRGQRDFYALRCGAQLGAKKFALANADGSRLLRNRIDGYGRVPVRHRAVRRGSDAILAATMRRDDRCRHSHIQNGAGGETNLRANARTEMGDRHGRVRLHRRHVSLLRRPARDRSTFAGRCLHFRLPATTRSAASRLDETAGENFARALVQEPEA